MYHDYKIRAFQYTRAVKNSTANPFILKFLEQLDTDNSLIYYYQVLRDQSAYIFVRDILDYNWFLLVINDNFFVRSLREKYTALQKENDENVSINDSALKSFNLFPYHIIRLRSKFL